MDRVQTRESGDKRVIASERLILAVAVDSVPTDLSKALSLLSDGDYVIVFDAAAPQHARLVYASSADTPVPDGGFVVVFGDLNRIGGVDRHPNVVDVIDWPADRESLERDLLAAVRRLRRELKRTADGEARAKLSAARVRIASADLDLDQLMALVCHELLALTTAEATVVEMVEADEILYRAAAGTIRDKVGFRMPVKGSLSGQVLDTGELLVSDDTENDPRVNRAATRALNIRSMAIAPLKSKAGLVGVLKMAASRPNAFGEVDLDAVAAMSDLIGGALQRELERAQLRSMAHTDPLTGMLNRRGFDEFAQRGVDRAGFDGLPSAALMIDIDHFKQINDTYGHAGGDAVLRSVSDTIRRLVRPSDVVGRIGGEEIAIVLPAAAFHDAVATAERIRIEIAATVVPFDGEWIRVTVSVGAAAVGIGASLEESLSLADEALYRAKNSGRNRVECAIPQPRPIAILRG